MKVKEGSLAALAFSVMALGGCQDTLTKINQDLSALNQNLKPNATNQAASSPNVMATQESSQTTQIKMTVPNDSKVQAAVDAALPTIKKIVTIHQCVKAGGGMRLLNAYALPGVGMITDEMGSTLNFPDSKTFMKYHDRTKCISIRAIDNFIMPAFNTLEFRTVYFAEDSGETVNFNYQLRKTDDGSWLLAKQPSWAGY